MARARAHARLRRPLGALTVAAITVFAPAATASAVITTPGGATTPVAPEPSPAPTIPTSTTTTATTNIGPSTARAAVAPARVRTESGGWDLPASMTVVSSTDITADTTLNFSSTITNDSWFDGGVSAHFMRPPGNGHLGPIWCTGNFRAGDSRTCSFQYQVTPDDVSRGQIWSEVQWEGTLAVIGIIPMRFSRGAQAHAMMNPARLSLTKTASPSTNVQAGTVVQYTFAGQNTGRTPLTAVGVADAMPSVSAPVCTPAAPAALAPGATINCTAQYTATTADVANGSITNLASINGLDLSQRPITASATATVTTDRTPNLSFVKSASPSSGVVAGNTITYTFIMANTGGTEFTSTQLSDPMAGLSGFTCDTPLASPLPIGNGRTCTATVAVTQADVDAGSIVNAVTFTAHDRYNTRLPATGSATVTTASTASAHVAPPAAPTMAPLYIDRRQRRERRKLRNRLFHRDPSVDRRTENRRRHR